MKELFLERAKYDSPFQIGDSVEEFEDFVQKFKDEMSIAEVLLELKNSGIDISVFDTKELLLTDHSPLLYRLQNLRENGVRYLSEFDIRAGLYLLSEKIEPGFRDEEVGKLVCKAGVKPGEVVVDLACGSGIVSYELARRFASVYAVDPSVGQLEMLNKKKGLYKNEGSRIKTIAAKPDSPTFIEDVRDRYGINLEGQADCIVSLGGKHHCDSEESQFVLMWNEARMLKPWGRIVSGDVGFGTTTAFLFDNVVARRCISGHHGVYFTKKRLRDYCEKLPLKLVSADIEDPKWKFKNWGTMVASLATLHAYPVDFDAPTENEVFSDRYTMGDVIEETSHYLGMTHRDGWNVSVNWRLLFWEIIKTEENIPSFLELFNTYG